MNTPKTEIGIVGGGLAGLATAVRLQQANLNPIIFEKADAIGGRVRTDNIDGFLVDRGFQVYLSAYPEAGKLLDLDALDLKHFVPGALVYHSGKLHRVVDPFRRPSELFSSAKARVGSLKDKLLVASLKRRLQNKTIQQIAASKDLTTQEWLIEFGFSQTMIDQFFKPFYGGIFLEDELRTSSQMFEFTFSTFSKGYASLPAKGMGSIPEQLASIIPEQSINLNTGVTSLTDTSITFESGDTRTFQSVILATDGSTASKICGSIDPPDAWRSVTNIYFTAPQSPLNEPIIALNGSGDGFVSNVSVLSDVVNDYSPDDRALISVSVLGKHETTGEFISTIRSELKNWFGSTKGWKFLHSIKIDQALPEQPPQSQAFSKNLFQLENGIFICGDHCASASIEGAITSGLRAAEAVIEKHST